MHLRVIVGLAEAKKELLRGDTPDISSLPADVVDRTEKLFGPGVSVQESVQRILDDVRRRGDEGVRHYTRLLDGTERVHLEVGREEMASAARNVPASLLEALKLASHRIEEFHRACLPKSWLDMPNGLGEMVTPLERVGVYAPGGTAAYPSTVLMTAIPAKVAGVGEVVLATPPRDGSSPSLAVLAAAAVAGVDRVFAVGGPQAIAAMAYGTESIPKVDLICGPGNVFVTLAKKLLFGQVGIDGLYGPTETLVVADETANPAYCAADLVAQAEHDAMAVPILATTSVELVAEVERELDRQLPLLERRDMAAASLERQGKVLLLQTIGEAIELANYVAPEHLCLMVKDPWSWAGKVRHAGGLFLGNFSPEVMGDYVAGPSHVMPTGGSARFSSALGVRHFLRTMPVIGLETATFSEVAEAASTIARAEGLTAHANAIQVRLASLRETERA